MFLLNPKYYKPLCEKLSELNTDDSLRMWAYSRIDTVRTQKFYHWLERLELNGFV